MKETDNFVVSRPYPNVSIGWHKLTTITSHVPTLEDNFRAADALLERLDPSLGTEIRRNRTFHFYVCLPGYPSFEAPGNTIILDDPDSTLEEMYVSTGGLNIIGLESGGFTLFRDRAVGAWGRELSAALVLRALREIQRLARKHGVDQIVPEDFCL